MSQLVIAKLWLPYKRNTHTRWKVQQRVFHDPVVARMAQIAALIDAEMTAPVYAAGVGFGTPGSAATFTSTSAVQTAVGMESTATDHAIMLLGWRIGYGASAAASGIPPRCFSCTWATNAPATNSTTVTITQVSGRTVASTNQTAAVNWTAEPTVKTYIEASGDIQPFGGNLVYDARSDTAPDTFNSGGMGFGVEHTPSAGTATGAAMLWCRC